MTMKKLHEELGAVVCNASLSVERIFGNIVLRMVGGGGREIKRNCINNIGIGRHFFVFLPILLSFQNIKILSTFFGYTYI